MKMLKVHLVPGETMAMAVNLTAKLMTEGPTQQNSFLQNLLTQQCVYVLLLLLVYTLNARLRLRVREIFVLYFSDMNIV